MKIAALSLALLVSAVQTVGWVECCCILVCKHHNDPCTDCKDKAQPAPEKACCKKKTEQHSRHAQGHGRCSHVEPSSEVSVHSPEPAPMPVNVVAELPVAAPLPAPVLGEERLIELDRARGSPPLLLTCSVLQI